MKKMISFDLDGTLADLNFEKAVWGQEIPKLFARKNSLSLSSAKAAVFAAYEMVGSSEVKWYDIKFWFREFGFGPEEYRKIMAESSHLIRLYPDTIPALEQLQAEFSLIIISNATREFINFKLKVEGLGKYFTRVFSTTSDFHSVKGNPEGYLAACREMGIRPSELVHIGDDYAFDYVAARKAGIDAYFLERKKTGAEVEPGKKVSDLGQFAALMLKKEKRKLDSQN